MFKLLLTTLNIVFNISTSLQNTERHGKARESGIKQANKPPLHSKRMTRSANHRAAQQEAPVITDGASSNSSVRLAKRRSRLVTRPRRPRLQLVKPDELPAPSVIIEQQAAPNYAAHQVVIKRDFRRKREAKRKQSKEPRQPESRQPNNF